VSAEFIDEGISEAAMGKRPGLKRALVVSDHHCGAPDDPENQGR